MYFTNSVTVVANISENDANWRNVIVCVKTIDAVLLFYFIYITGALIVYGAKKNKFKRQSDADFTGGVVYIMPITASIFCCLRLLWSLVGEAALSVYQTGRNKECDVYNIALHVPTTLCLLTTYMTLYLRQKVFYDHPMWTTNINRYIVLLGKYSGVLIAALVLVIFVVKIGASSTVRESSRLGCVSHISSKGDFIWVVTITAILTIQVMSLVLFIVPLVHARRHFKSMRKFKVTGLMDTSSTTQESNTETKEKDVDEALNILKRSLFAAISCSMSDTLAFFTVVIIPDEYPIIIKVLAWNISLCINVFCLLVSIRKWRDLLFLTKCLKSNSKSHSLEVSGGI